MLLSRSRVLPLPAPGWERCDEGESLVFSAARSRLATFAAATAVITLCAGALVSALAILLAPESGSAARILIVAAALCLCLPLLLLVKAPFRARTRLVRLAYDDEALTLAIGADAHRVPFGEMNSLVWCTGTEYARIVLDWRGGRCSLLAGIARPLSGHRADLPELSSDLRRVLERAGLTASARTPGYTRYRR